MTTNNPLISVIIPCYNQGEYLKEAVTSVLNQEYDNIEIIVVDDGSTDQKTLQILNNFKFPKSRLIRQKNSGLSIARNTGIDSSNGSYIIPLDCDDKLNSNYISKCISYIKRNPGIGIVYTNIKVFGDYDDKVKLNQIDNISLLYKNSVSVTAFFKRSVFEDIKRKNNYGYNPNMVGGYEDWDFWISALESGYTFKYLDEDIFLYRKHGPSMIDSAEKKHDVLFSQIIKNHEDSYKKNCLDIIKRMKVELNAANSDNSNLQFGLKEYIKKTNSFLWLIKRIFFLALKKIHLK